MSNRKHLVTFVFALLLVASSPVLGQAPTVSVTPASLSAELCPGSTTTSELTICNTGEAPLAWQIGEVAFSPQWSTGVLVRTFVDHSGTMPMSADSSDTYIFTVSGGNPQNHFARYLPDGTFDAAFDSSVDFRSIDTKNGGELYAKAFSGPFYSITEGGAASFLFALSGSDPNAKAAFNADDTELYVRSSSTVRRYDAATGALLAALTLNALSDGENAYPASFQLDTDRWGRMFTYADGVVSQWDLAGNRIGTTTIPIATPSDFFTTFSFAVDRDGLVYLFNAVTLNWEVYDIGLSDIPWLGETPLDGTLAAGACVPVTVTFDSTGLAFGGYSGALVITSDDPASPERMVPVNLAVVNAPPSGDFSWLPSAPLVGDTVDFTATVSGAEPLTIDWDLGNGTTGSGATVSHVYAAPGDYTVQLTATNSCDTLTVGHLVTVAPREGDVEVTPSSLSAQLCPDQTATRTLTVCNTGTVTLIWSLLEEPGALKVAAPGRWQPAAPVTLPAGPRARSLDGPANPHLDPAIVQETYAPMSAVLLNQPPNQTNGLFADVSCSLCPNGMQSIADNFILDHATQVQEIVLWSGYYSADTPIDPDTIRVLIHQDAGGVPGAVLYDESNVAYSRAQTGVVLFGVHEWRHVLTLGTPVALPSGTYWVEVFNNTGADNDDFFWEVGNLDAVHGVYDSRFAQETPGAMWYGNGGSDFAFQIVGTPDVPWLSEAPRSGTVAPGDCTDVDVTFDTAGLAPGGHTADLLVTSNDPDEPNVTIPVSLTVDPPPAITSAAGTSFNILAASSFTVTATGIPTPVLTVADTLPAGVTFVDHGNGTATLAGTPKAGTAGTYPLTIKANGCGESTQSFALKVLGAKTTTAVTSYPRPSQVGQSVRLTARVSFTNRFLGAPAGTITFVVGTTPVATVPVVGAAASTSFTFTAPGTHVVTAMYSGDKSFASSRGNLTGGQIVNGGTLR